MIHYVCSQALPSHMVLALTIPLDHSLVSLPLLSSSPYYIAILL